MELLAIALLCFVVAKSKRALFEYPHREQQWRDADAVERENMVRRACAERVIGRVLGAGALITGAFFTTSPALIVMWSIAAFRVVKPIKQEMRDACSYRSTGSRDESPYSW